MGRLPVGRAPAAPSSANQQQRYQRILDAAVKHGSLTDFDRVQMQDIATEAEVAIATLYRYFPSKTHLFVGVMKAQVDRVDPADLEPADGVDPATAVGDLLADFLTRLTENRRLSLSMVQAIIHAEGMRVPDRQAVEDSFHDLILHILGWDADPTEDQTRRVWLVIQCFFGVLTTSVGGRRKVERADTDIRRACELLLGFQGDRAASEASG